MACGFTADTHPPRTTEQILQTISG
jgi:hypothetical protein